MWSSLDGRAAGAESAPCSRSKHSACLLDGYVWVLGGRGNGPKRPLRDLWRYSLANHVWERLPSLGDAPPSLEQHSCIARDGKLYVFGGELAPSGETPLWIYDTQVTGILTGVWRKVASTAGSRGGAGGGRGQVSPTAAGGPRGRRAHVAFDLQDCMLVYGGYMDLKGSTDEMWAFHYESERWQQVRAARCGAGAGGTAVPRHGAAGCARGTRLYVHAGRTDLKLRNDLHYYDTESRSWHEVRCVARVSPAARCGHAAVRAGAHLYIFGGQTDTSLADDLWRFHFDSETWERIENKPQWPSPRVESCALLISTVVTRPSSLKTSARPHERNSNNGYTHGCNGNGGYNSSDGSKTYCHNNGGNTNYDSNDDSYGYSSMCSGVTPSERGGTRPPRDPPAPAPAPAPATTPSGIISKISSHIRRSSRADYTALSTELDSLESVVCGRVGSAPLAKSLSAHVIHRRDVTQRRDAAHARDARTRTRAHAHTHSPPEGDVPHTVLGCMSREPISVPNFADLVVLEPVLSPVQAARLVYLDSDDERDYNTNTVVHQPPPLPAPPPPPPRAGVTLTSSGVTLTSSGVRFSAALSTPAEEDHPYCTSDYASAEKINRLSVISGTSLGFCNPHYLGPDVRRLSALTPVTPVTPAPRADPATPDSGVEPGDIELRDMSRRKDDNALQQAKNKGTRLLVLLVGGRETQRLALMQRPLSLWTYRLL